MKLSSGTARVAFIPKDDDNECSCAAIFGLFIVLLFVCVISSLDQHEVRCSLNILKM